jgi:uncharacterized protein YaeQ
VALKSTIFKVRLDIADMDRHHYQDYHLTIARHPSETDERMMMRILSFALFAHEDLELARGLSTDDEPDLWQKELSGEIEHWIDLGQPDEKRIRRACGRARQVSIVCYSGNSAAIWFDKIKNSLTRFSNLQIFSISAQQAELLAGLVGRTMTLHISIEDRQVFISAGNEAFTIDPVVLFPAVN